MPSKPIISRSVLFHRRREIGEHESLALKCNHVYGSIFSWLGRRDGRYNPLEARHTKPLALN